MSNNGVTEKGVVSISKSMWNIARARAKAICPIAEGKVTKTSKAVKNAAIKLQLSERTLYNYIKKWKNSNGSILVFVPIGSSGGKSKSRLTQKLETIISNTIDEEYLSKQKISTSSLYRLIREKCFEADIKAPSINTIRSRLDKIKYSQLILKREGKNSFRKTEPIIGRFPKVKYPLDVIQIDHTLVDIIVVDSYYRQPIGRPWITVAIDVYTRCIVGIYLTLDSPSATSVGMCLANVVADKSYWLEKIGADVQWNMGGKPSSIYVDNGSDFHSEALKRGCEVHGIKLSYRPVGSPHYGGIVERVIGTMMKMIHELPGTTFSNVSERGEYQSEKKASLNISELEKWIVMAVAVYHQSIHSTFKRPPIALWKDAISSSWKPYYVENIKNFLVDFLPIVYRKIQRHGFKLHHIIYMSNALKPWINKTKEMDRFIIRYDPRDLSKIFVLPPNEMQYIEVPYADIENIAINLWEHKAAIKALKETGKQEVKEKEIIRIVKKMREISKDAASKSKKARRIMVKGDRLRNQQYSSVKLEVPDDKSTVVDNIIPFKDMEEW